MELLERLNTIATVKENEIVEGIEVYFDTKPDYDIIKELKENKFRWHNVKKCWYVKKSLLTGESKPVAKKEERTMKEFTKVTDYNEFIELFKDCHNGWVSDDKYMNQLFKNSLYLKTKDGYYITFDTKFDIDTDMWFDDEQPIPEKSEELFINYNMHNVRYDFSEYLKAQEDLKKYRCCSASHSEMFISRCYNDPEYKHVRINNASWQKEQAEFVRDLTKEEIEEIIEFTEELKQNYIERLKKYYKRYNKNIWCRGYWVNR